MASLKLAGQVDPFGTALVWEPEGGKLAVFTYDNQLCQIWDVPTGSMIQTFPAVDLTDTVSAWSPDGRSLALGTKIYDVETGRRIMTYTVAGSLVSQAWSPNGKRLAVRSFLGIGLYTNHSSILSLRDASTGKQLAGYDQGTLAFGERMPSSPKKMAWSPDGKHLLILRDGIEIWRMEEG
jgi:WD40 repeat protein